MHGRQRAGGDVARARAGRVRAPARTPLAVARRLDRGRSAPCASSTAASAIATVRQGRPGSTPRRGGRGAPRKGRHKLRAIVTRREGPHSARPPRASARLPVASPRAASPSSPARSSGIGAAIARRSRRRGWRCVLLARRRGAARGARGGARRRSTRCATSPTATRSSASRRAMLERHPRDRAARQQRGHPGRGRLPDAEPERIEQVMRDNYLGSRLVPARVPAGLEAAARRTSSTSSPSPGRSRSRRPGRTRRRSTRSSRSRARSPALLRRRGIRVHTVYPGFVETEGFPQRRLLAEPVLRRVVIEPEGVAKRLVDAVERDARVVRPRAGTASSRSRRRSCPGWSARAGRRSGERRRLRPTTAGAPAPGRSRSRHELVGDRLGHARVLLQEHPVADDRHRRARPGARCRARRRRRPSRSFRRRGAVRPATSTSVPVMSRRNPSA